MGHQGSLAPEAAPNGTPASGRRTGAHQPVERSAARPGFVKWLRLTDAEGKRTRFKRQRLAAFRVDGVDYRAFRLRQNSTGIRLVDPVYNVVAVKGEVHLLRLLRPPFRG